jgi:hypothetical protein
VGGAHRGGGSTVVLPLDFSDDGDALAVDKRRWGEEGLMAQSNEREKGEGGGESDDSTRWPL